MDTNKSLSKIGEEIKVGQRRLLAAMKDNGVPDSLAYTIDLLSQLTHSCLTALAKSQGKSNELEELKTRLANRDLVLKKTLEQLDALRSFNSQTASPLRPLTNDSDQRPFHIEKVEQMIFRKGTEGTPALESEDNQQVKLLIKFLFKSREQNLKIIELQQQQLDERNKQLDRQEEQLIALIAATSQDNDLRATLLRELEKK